MADQHASQLQEHEVEVGPAFPPSPEPLIGVQPGEATLYHPAVLAQPGTAAESLHTRSLGKQPRGVVMPVYPAR